MSTIRLIKDTSVLVAPVAAPREPSAASIARQAARAELVTVLGKIKSEKDVFQIDLDTDEKPLTVRQRILSVAKSMNKEIVVRKHGEGFAIGLLTPDRIDKRGRRKVAAQPE